MLELKRNLECDATKEQIEDALMCVVHFDGEYIILTDMQDPIDWVKDAADAEGFTE